VFAYELPDGVLPEVARRKWESEDLEGVIANLAHWFGDTVEGVKERLKLEWADPVSYPHLQRNSRV
jgi:hypothetical protein